MCVDSVIFDFFASIYGYTFLVAVSPLCDAKVVV